MYENILSIDKICRACLKEGANFKSLTYKIENDGRTISEVLSFVSNIDISNNDKYPKQICDACQGDLFKADEFKKRCAQSETVLRVCFGRSDASKSVKKENIPDSNDDKFYQCSVCFLKFSNVEGLETHLSRHRRVKQEVPSSSELEIEPIFIEKDDTNLNLEIEAKPLSNLKTEIEIEFNDDNYVPDIYSDDSQTIPNLIYLKETSRTLGHDFICKHCGESFDTKKLLKKHSVIHKKVFNDFECSLCMQKFEHRELLATHIEHHNEVKKSSGSKMVKTAPNHVCEECGEVFINKNQLRKHSVVHKPLKDYECSMCRQKFKKKSSMATHIRSHTEFSKMKYMCMTCNREFQHKAHLDKHILSVHGTNEGFACDRCSSWFSTEKLLEVHQLTHQNEKKYQCKVCGKAFIMGSTLEDHLRTHTGEKPFLCSVCGRGFSQKTNLEQHVRRHLGIKKFKCEQCERGFVSKGELVAHQRKHSGAHPFICPDCGNGFTTSSSLVKHRRTHTGERPYACDLCPMKFRVSGTLKNHRRTHTGEKPYQCSHCEKAFIQRQDLVSHIRCHTGERPYNCNVCGQTFRKASALKAHFKIHV